MSADGFLLAAYDRAWRMSLGPLRSAVRLDAALRRTVGRGFLPARWLAERRLGDGPSALEARPGRAQAGLPCPPHAPGDSPPPSVWLHAASLGESKGLWALA